MTETSVPSARAKKRASAKALREARAARRQVVFEAVAAGWSIEQIADLQKVRPRTVRREMDRALAERRLDAPDRYVHLQVARLTKAVRLADAAIDAGDLKAVNALVKVVRALDRYHGLAALAAASPSAPAEILPPPAPTLRLTQAAPAERPAQSDSGTCSRIQIPEIACSTPDVVASENRKETDDASETAQDGDDIGIVTGLDAQNLEIIRPAPARRTVESFEPSQPAVSNEGAETFAGPSPSLAIPLVGCAS